jgi:predicted small metal-binding protein
MNTVTRREASTRRMNVPYSIRCGDVVPGCAAVLRGDDEPRVLAEVAAHAAVDHPDLVLTPAAEAAVRSAIRPD